MITTDIEDLIINSCKFIGYGISRAHIDRNYQDLYTRFVRDSEFKNMVNLVANGFKLEVIYVNEEGIILVPLRDSIFHLPNHLNSLLKGNDVHLYTLILIGLFSYFYPQGNYYNGPVTIPELNGLIRDKSEEIYQRLTDEEKKQGDLDEKYFLMCREFRLLSNREEKQSKERSSSHYYIKFVLDKLKDQKYFVKDGEDFIPTLKFEKESNHLISMYSEQIDLFMKGKD